MKFSPLCLLALLTVPCSAAPVHIALKSSAAAPPNADGFLTLGSVSTLTGGDKAARVRYAAVLIARAPLSGETRQLTRGDLALKLRQAGINPETQVILEGATKSEVTTEVPPAPNNGGVGVEAKCTSPGSDPAPPLLGAGGTPNSPLIHSGDAVTITIQSGPMTITAPAIARESGRRGDTIRVHRDGVMTDLSVQVIDAQTVQMGV